MNIAIFTEAGQKKGLGHFMRCFSLYQSLKKNHCPDFYLDIDNGVNLLEYNLSYQKISFLNNTELQKEYEIIIIDSYLASIEVYNFLAKKCQILVCFDDFSRLCYPKKAIIINASVFAKKTDYKNNQNSLLGLKYLALRSEIKNFKTNKKKNKLIIMLGGFDSANLIPNILKNIEKIECEKVIISAKKTNISLDYKNTRLLMNPKSSILFNELKDAKVAIVTASTSLYEMNYFGAFTIATSVSFDQEHNLNALKNEKLIDYFLDLKKESSKTKLPFILEKFLAQKNKKNLSQIDDLGAFRIVNYLENKLCKNF